MGALRFSCRRVCLGVKDAGFHRFSVCRLPGKPSGRLFHDEDPVRMTPAAARKLARTRSATQESRFSPGVDYKRRAAFSAASQRWTAMGNLCSAKTKTILRQGRDPPARPRILRALEPVRRRRLPLHRRR
jgi:hypothetical protein